MRTSHPLALRLREFIRTHELLKRGERVAVGFSGGPDSTCLLHLLLQLGYKVIALHLNHGQRREADEEERLCALRAREWGAEFLSEKWSVPDFARQQGISLEEAGRILRYRFFEKISAEKGGLKIATAHTMDDSVETMLINLARGTGMTGLTGIPIRRGAIIRPLLWARRQETRAYCQEHSLPTFADPTNLSPAFMRGRLRKRLLPLWETLHPHAVENADRTAKILAEENHLLEELANELLAQSEKLPKVLPRVAQKVERQFYAEKLRKGNQALIRRAILQTLKSLSFWNAPFPSPTFETLNSSAQALLDREQASFTLPGGEVVIEVFPQRLRVRSLRPALPFREPLRVPGSFTSPEGLWRLSARVSPSPPRPKEAKDREMVGIPLRNVPGKLLVRSASPRDRILLPQKGAVSVLNKWQELGLSAPIRARLPVVCDEAGVLWAPGMEAPKRRALRKRQGWLVLTIEACSENPMV